MTRHRYWPLALATLLASMLTLLALAVRAEPAATNGSAVQSDSPVTIEYFYETGCAECFRVETEILPALEVGFSGFYTLRPLELGNPTHFARLASYMEKFGVNRNARVFMVVNGRTMLAGLAEMQTALLPAVEREVLNGLPPELLPFVETEPATVAPVLSRRMERFTLLGVVLGGLVDGINPCAISTLVFLISMLAVAGGSSASVLALGSVYCLAVFLTYTAIGLGLLQALHALTSLRSIQLWVDVVLVAGLCVLAVVSFGDAARYRRTGQSRDVMLQLPDAIKERIHRLVRGGLRNRRAGLLSVFALGVAVTALESVCTGQVYVPTLALMVKSGADRGRGLGLLLLYNLMFVLPLIAVFVLTHAGLRFTRLLAWSRGNVVYSKVLLGLFFLGLAAAALALR